jgi:hypothetical protein
MNNEKTTYVGSGKKQSDSWLKVTVNVDKIKDYVEEYKGHKFVRLNINLKDQLDQFGKDVSISIDKFEPQQQDSAPAQKRPGHQDEAQDEAQDDLPF